VLIHPILTGQSKMPFDNSIFNAHTNYGPKEALEGVEQEIAVQASVECFNELQEYSSDLDRMERVAGSLEDLAIVAENVGTAKLTDAAFVHVAMDLATAGTNVSAEDLVPAVEDIEGSTISTEGIREVASSVWEAIKRALKAMWKKVKEFWRKLTSAIPGLKKAAAKLQKRASDSVSKTTEESKVELGREVNTLAVDHVAPKNGSDINTSLGKLSEVCEGLFDDFTRELPKAGEIIADAIGEVDPLDRNTAGGAILVTLATGLIKLNPPIHFKGLTTIKGDKRFPIKDGTGGVETLPLPGNMSLFAYTTILPNRNNDDLQLVADILRRSKVEIKNTREKPKDAIDSADINVIPPETCISIAETITDICEFLERHEKSKNFDKIEKAKERMEKASDSLDKSLRSAEKDDKFNRADKPVINSIIGFNKAFAQWATTPQAQLSSHAVAVCRAAIVACNKSLSLYK
jgi:hypothetical protein